MYKILFSSAFLLLCCGCNSRQAPGAPVAIANPASVYCLKKGGKLVIAKDESGEKGMCHLPDGTVIEEWALFRLENPQK
jgi:putative hemolysin